MTSQIIQTVLFNLYNIEMYFKIIKVIFNKNVLKRVHILFTYKLSTYMKNVVLIEDY